MSRAYIKTDTILDKILAQKLQEVGVLRQSDTAALRRMAETADTPRDMFSALNQDHVSLIAEVKHASPSKGVLIEDFQPLKLAQSYVSGGAAAISVLTDQQFFQGHLDHMTQVRDAVPVPVLRKDFIISPLQIYEARAARADAILLIVAALEDAPMADLFALSQSLGMTVLVEVHNEAELARAVKLGAKLIGVNNRDLKSFHVDLETTARLASQFPADCLLVAESGLRNPEDVQQMGRYGAAAVLVGETLVKSEDLVATVRAFSSQKRQQRT